MSGELDMKLFSREACQSSKSVWSSLPTKKFQIHGGRSANALFQGRDSCEPSYTHTRTTGPARLVSSDEDQFADAPSKFCGGAEAAPPNAAELR